MFMIRGFVNSPSPMLNEAPPEKFANNFDNSCLQPNIGKLVGSPIQSHAPLVGFLAQEEKPQGSQGKLSFQ